MEKNEKGKPFLPDYLVNRIYIDLTEENGYDELLLQIRQEYNEKKA